MLLTLGECHRNASAAVRRYYEKFSNRRIPNRKTFYNIELRLLEHESLKYCHIDAGRPRFVRRVDNEKLVLEAVEENASILQDKFAINWISVYHNQ